MDGGDEGEGAAASAAKGEDEGVDADAVVGGSTGLWLDRVDDEEDDDELGFGKV